MSQQSLQRRKLQSILHFFCNKLHSKASLLPVAKSHIGCPGRMLICYQLRNSENRLDNPFLGLMGTDPAQTYGYELYDLLISSFWAVFLCFCDLSKLTLDFNPIYPTQTKGKFVYQLHICPVKPIDQNKPMSNPSIHFMPYKYIFQCYLFS